MRRKFNSDHAQTLAHHRSESVAFYKERYAELSNYLREELNPALRKKFGGDKEYVSIVNEPDAGFHIALDFSALKDTVVNGNGASVTLETSAHMAVALMEKAKVVAYPGEMFYLEGEDMILRASLNLEKEKLLEALTRIKDFCLELEPPAKWEGRASVRPPRAHRGAA
jgi:aspartate/methionine/tyrosine aminotransferase